MIYRSFPDIYAIGHGFYRNKKVLSVVYPELKKPSRDTSARKFLIISVKNF